MNKFNSTMITYRIKFPFMHNSENYVTILIMEPKLYALIGYMYYNILRYALARFLISVRKTTFGHIEILQAFLDTRAVFQIKLDLELLGRISCC